MKKILTIMTLMVAFATIMSAQNVKAIEKTMSLGKQKGFYPKFKEKVHNYTVKEIFSSSPMFLRSLVSSTISNTINKISFSNF